ncbi:aspartyl-phosphate phosphatase Spo0E family protein [Brevibacillus daliensis]|uniref:aspartyl-phosphate phosphatase Spo0E family protein n=1 Tax=Brevibacillus daliensis TaxID=2892995 RepID=UPI001E520348|nr:aspartyl-phosphate phosphatase Spo0E family protein [Brevibacillus daliensis]
MTKKCALSNRIESLRKELNDKYKRYPAITPEMMELSVKLDQLLNEWQNTTYTTYDRHLISHSKNQ